MVYHLWNEVRLKIASHGHSSKIKDSLHYVETLQSENVVHLAMPGSTLSPRLVTVFSNYNQNYNQCL